MPQTFAPYFLHSNIHTKSPLPQTADEFFDGIFGNSGNSFITYAVLKWLGTDTSYLNAQNSLPNMFTQVLSDAEAERINANFSHILITTQDYLRAGWDDDYFAAALANLKKLKLPLVVFSLGTNSFEIGDESLASKLTTHQHLFFKEIAARCQNIAVRGEYTAQVLRSMGIENFTITGCPTHYIKGRTRQFIKKPWDAQKKIAATGLCINQQQDELHYYFQDERLLAKALYFSDDFSQEDLAHHSNVYFSNPYIHPYTQSILRALIDGRASLFADMSAWENDLAERCNMALGTRVHGAVMALNAGIPAIVTNGDARSKEMCALFGIPHYPQGISPDASLQDLFEAYDFTDMQTRYQSLYDGWSAWAHSVGLAQNALANTTQGQAPHSMTLLPEAQRAERLETLLNLLAYSKQTAGKNLSQAWSSAPTSNRLNALHTQLASISHVPVTAPQAGALNAVAAAGGISLATSDNTHNSLYVVHTPGAVRLTTDTGGAISLCANGTEERLTILPQGGVLLHNQTTPPSTPTQGGILYVENGELKYMSSQGVISPLTGTKSPFILSFLRLCKRIALKALRN